MNIPPFLERLLLSNEAEFKNASLGLSGQNMVFVPQGKTAVILEVSIEPFCNQITPAVLSLFTSGSLTNSANAYIQAIRKIHYQLQIINDKYSTYINLANDFEIKSDIETLAIDDYVRNNTVNLQFTGKREELFIYTDRSMYFNIIYPYQENEIDPANSGLSVDYTTPNVGFLPKIQNLPKSPITFNGNIFQDYVVNVQVNSPDVDHYYPVGHQTNPGYSPELPQMEYLRFFAGVNQTSIQQPVDSGLNYNWHDLFTLPLINVKYALLNKRASDYGITTPGK